MSPSRVFSEVCSSITIAIVSIILTCMGIFSLAVLAGLPPAYRVLGAVIAFAVILTLQRVRQRSNVVETDEVLVSVYSK